MRLAKLGARGLTRPRERDKERGGAAQGNGSDEQH
jgi:hypothetical protein